jgi:two-component system cell cycle sensor histidine kinase/response regulator CckA
MPEMLGNKLATHVRAVRPGIPVLYMSGYARTVLDSQDALEPGVDLLEKPFAQTTLLRRVRRSLDTAGEPAGPPSAGR